MKVNKKEIRELYSETLSLENVRCILHISKRKAAWMLQNGIIKCEISEKKTKQYKVRIEELFAYLARLSSQVQHFFQKIIRKQKAKAFTWTIVN